MSSRSGQQNLTNWLILIPLTIVPAIAVFGVPELGSLSAGNNSVSAELPELTLGSEAPLNGEIPSLMDNDLGQPTAGTDAPLAESGWNDPFESPPRVSSESRSMSRPIAAEDFDPANAFADANVAPRSSRSTATNAQHGISFSGPPDAVANRELKAYSRENGSEQRNPIRQISHETEEAEETLSWREAVRKLNQLGVREIQLAQTEEPFVFRFSCDYTPGNNPRITRRFEAESGEPLKAVEQVIQQVESWLARPTP